MANNQNNETANTVGLVAIIGVMTIVGFGFILVALAAFATLIALCAQFKTVTIAGESITAREGRRFIFWGQLGTLPCAALLLQVADWIDLTIQNDWIWAVFVLAYSMSSLGIAWIVETFWGKGSSQVTNEVTPPSIPETDHRRLETKSYSFADWQDDEEVDPYK